LREIFGKRNCLVTANVSPLIITRVLSTPGGEGGNGMKTKKLLDNFMLMLVMALQLIFAAGCHAQPLASAPKLTFETGADKGEIRYSWTAVPGGGNAGEVSYTLLVLKGWHGADAVIAYGSREAGGTGAHSGAFMGGAGEWYSAAVMAENGSDISYSEARQAKAKRTGAGEYDLRFGVVSDTHVGFTKWEVSYYPTHQRFEKVLDWYNTEDVQTLAIVGDLTGNGSQDHWDIFKNSWKNHKGGLQLIAVMGNHEVDGEYFYGEDKNIAADRFESATGQKTNAHYVIDGYHFIVLSAGAGAFIDQGAAGGAIASGRTEVPGSVSDGDNVSLAVRMWARERIDAAKADAPGMPIFVFLHWPIRNTSLGSNANYTSSFGSNPLTGFFRNDSEVIIFSGHVHRPNNDPRSIWQGGFTAVKVPSLYHMILGSGYLGNSIDGIVTSAYPKLMDPTGQGLIVSVKASKVTIENFDFDFHEGPQPLGNVVRIPQTWEFDVSQPSDFPYTNARRETQKTAPVFDKTEITIKNISANSIEVEFPQAKIPGANYGNEIVFSYRFDFINRQTGDVERSVRQWSDFMLTPRLQKPAYTQLIGGLTPNTNYELRIYAYGSFQECSTQYLTCIFRTPR